MIVSCRKPYVISGQPSAQLVDYSTAQPDSGILALVQPYRQKHDSIMNRNVGYLGETMEKGYPEGKLGNYIADVLLQTILDQQKYTSSNTFCLINNGGLRVPLQKGAVTKGKVFELMPFENAISVVKLKGSVLSTTFIPYLVEKKGQPVSKNVAIHIKENKLESFHINKIPLDTASYYYVVTSDYLSGGGDNMSFFMQGEKQAGLFTTLKLRDAILQYLEHQTSEQNPGMSVEYGRMKLE